MNILTSMLTSANYKTVYAMITMWNSSLVKTSTWQQAPPQSIWRIM